MSYCVYIIYSKSSGSLYKGQTSNLFERLKRHNHGYETYTASGLPWRMVWYCFKDTRKEAMILEKKLKNLSVSRIKEFIGRYPVEDPIMGLDLFDPWGN